MKALLCVMRSRKGRRSLEVALIMLLLLLVFSIAGVPMILLSTFAPSWNHDGLEPRNAEVFSSEALDASVAV